MSTEGERDLPLEIGHVLFIDIVGYSKLLINEQSDRLEHLKEMVRGSEQVRAADTTGKLIRLAAGDGMALVFRDSPEAPAQCALELARADRKHPELKLRMGIHSGPINEVTDVNERVNVTGAGINIAQRVMDCGDAGHILLSQHVADDLEQYPRWRPLLHEIGEYEMKHGVRLRVVNLYTDDLGNPVIPGKLQRVASEQQAIARTQHQIAGRRRVIRIGAALLALVLLLGATIWLLERSGKHTDQGPLSLIPDKSVAVLPFENLSQDPDNAYFVSGVQDMILTRLAKIGDLKVISRNSTEKYESRPDDLKIVAQQLGVATIIEGSVQKSGNQVLINVRLIDANTARQIWADAYPRTLENIFGVEGEVAQKVADALKAKLTPVEAADVLKVPTQNAAAYDMFLKAEYQAQRASDSEQWPDFLSADADYEQAIALDPNFALAYANLAYNQMNRHWVAKNLTTAELAAVKTAIDRALALEPNLPEAHLALGYYDYWGFLRYDAAIEEFQRTLQLAPSNVLALAGLALVARRAGHWPQALTYLEKALLISPRDGFLLGENGTTYEVLRRYSEAERQLERALERSPTDANAKDHLLTTRLFGFGDVQGAREAFHSPPAWRTDVANQFTGDGDVLYLINPRVYPDVFERRFVDALSEWDSAPNESPEARLTGQVARVAINIIAGERQTAGPECEQLGLQLQAELTREPDSLSWLDQLSWVNLCLGRNADAVATARRAVALLPIEKDAWSGAGQLVGLAQIAAQAGAPDEALKVIHQLLSIPAGDRMSIERLELDPVWDPLRNDPRFQKLAESPNPKQDSP